MLGIGSLIGGLVSKIPLVGDLLGGILGGGSNHQRSALARPGLAQDNQFGRYLARFERETQKAVERNARVLDKITRTLDIIQDSRSRVGRSVTADARLGSQAVLGRSEFGTNIPSRRNMNIGNGASFLNGKRPMEINIKNPFLSAAARLLLSAFGSRNGNGVSISLKFS